MQNIHQQIDELRMALKKALTGHAALKRTLLMEQERLQQLLVDKQTLQKEVTTLQEQVKTLKLAQAIQGSENQPNHELKLQINRYIREIDKCLQLINRH